ncbi:zinc finger and BTB domain-containing protein 12 [Sphaeramia orbicularis]|uniref:Zinc finger and BTB domain containing 12, tandem duplicate 2 n=1 Tax=Sphaeramia orbicularis TaxID=375764 RepID=A0A672ZBZ9_9TELE|nr:zinc finger and BTB domain-containing protein 12 [Sphaeramia orbicularis]
MMEMLCFRLPGHGDITLKHMNSLRFRQHFCDITIVASDNQTFRGHKVVLAACSPYLRDQFLLNPSSKLQVSMLYSSTVVCDLLQSCYTGVLQFNPEEIVNYLTAASYLQMEHIVERCRGALKKYVQLKQPSPPKMIAEENQASPMIVSGSIYSVASASPPASRTSPAPPQSPAGRSVEENQGNVSAQGSSQHQSDSPSLDEPCIEVNASDEEEGVRQDDYDIFRVYVSGEQMNKDKEEREAPSDQPQDVCYPETEGIMIGEGGEYDLNPTEDGLSAENIFRQGISVEGFHAFRRKITNYKIGRGRGKGRGRGLKRRRWEKVEKRSPGIGNHQDLWYIANSGMGGAFGLDFSQEGLKTGNYVSVEVPQLDFNVGDAQGEKVSPLVTNSMAQFGLEESTAGEGSSGLTTVPSSEGGDESVAVVESTSSVVGPVICEHCGMTFPSPQSLAIHCRTTHLLFVCPCCGKHFHHSANLSRHMAVHRGTSKSHQCPLCYKTFTQKSTLIDHMNLHSGERPHRCAYCHARFAHKPALRRHLKEQHGKTTGQNSLHEQEERERAQGGEVAERIRQEQECFVTEHQQHQPEH